MPDYPPVVAKIANDYLERLKAQLGLVPARERDDFLLEIRSHLYEAYQQTSGEDEVDRILGVLRNLGEPAEVVSDRLPGAMMRTGAQRNLPLLILGGILIALFGIPLGFGGVGVLLGFLGALTGIVAAYYATTGSILLVGSLLMLLGLTRAPTVEFLDHFSPSDQGLFMILIAGVFIASGLGLLWLGRYLLRGLRFLFSLAFDWTRRLGQAIRRRLRHNPSEGSQGMRLRVPRDTTS